MNGDHIPRIPRRLCLTLLLTCALAAPAAAGGTEGAWRKAIDNRDDAGLARLLEDAQAPVTARGRHGVTALMVAARAGSAPLVEQLLARGARVEAERRGGAKALHYAAQGGHPQIIRRLVRAGAELNAPAANGWTALTVAAALGRAAAVDTLLEAGADPNRVDVYGWTPLMRAVDNAYPEAVRVLLSHPAVRLDLTDDAGMTALHHAARRGMDRLAVALLEHCANPRVRDQNGFTPAILARRTGHGKLAPLLGQQPSRCRPASASFGKR